MAIATGIVGDVGVGAVLASADMAAEGCCATRFDRRHDAQLAKAQMAGLRLTIS
jgi:hypothetical protein